jgi:hypothetical protein
MRTSIFLLFAIFSIVSCIKDDQNDDSVLYDNNYYLFNFDYNNSYIIQSIQDTITTENGFFQNKFSSNNFQAAEPSASIWLTDGEINDTLRSCCSNYNYQKNPSTIIRIWFPSSSITDGIYKYDFDSTSNEFHININNQMHFSNIWESTETNYLDSSNIIASSSGHNPSDNKVDNAKIKIENLNTLEVSVKFIINTMDGNIIKGSYQGNLNNFLYQVCDSDCD